MVSLIAGLAIMYLFAREFQEYRQVKTESSMYVDLSIGEKLAINFDVTFAAFPCAALHLDAMDISGYQQLDLDHDIYKQRLNSDGSMHRQPKEKHVIGEDSEETYQPSSASESTVGAPSRRLVCAVEMFW